MEDWAEIRRLRRAEGLPIKMIARTLGIAPNNRPGGAGGLVVVVLGVFFNIFSCADVFI